MSDIVIINRQFSLQNSSGIGQTAFDGEVVLNFPVQNAMFENVETVIALIGSSGGFQASRVVSNGVVSITPQTNSNISSVSVDSQSDPDYTLNTLSDDNDIVLKQGDSPQNNYTNIPYVISSGELTIKIRSHSSTLNSGDSIRAKITFVLKRIK